MAFVFVLDAGSLELTRRRFTTLPIRIGRNALNDCPIVHAHVSNFHARIDDVGGNLCVEDLDSKNGVLFEVPGSLTLRPIPRRQPVELAATGFHFYLGPEVKISVSFETLKDPVDQRLATSFSGSVLGNRSALFGPSIAPSSSVPSPQPGAAGAQGDALNPYFPATPQPMPSPWAGQPNAAAGRRGPSTQFFTDLGPEYLAFQGLREITQPLVPSAKPDPTDDASHFLTKTHNALQAFVRSAIPLREGYAQFIACFDLPHEPRQHHPHRSPASAAVEAAATPEALAHALLDPADRSFDAPRTLEGIFADLMMHQMAVLDGMMRGVRALLDELSPQRIASEAGQGFAFRRYKAQWEAYARRFEDLYEERKTFAIVFGPEFAMAYRRYRQGGTDGGERSG